MCAMFSGGKTLREVGSAFGLTSERVRQILRAEGVGTGGKRRSRYFELAHRYVSVAIYNGDLPKLDGTIKCADCDAPAAEYDHRDYKKPMEVEPVCRACNQARGPGKHRDPTETAAKPLSIRKRFDQQVA